MPLGPFGEALMRYSRVRAPATGGARFGGRAPNADALRMAQPTPPAAIKPSEAASEAQLPPEIKAYLDMMAGVPGQAAPVKPPLTQALPPALAPSPAPLPGAPGLDVLPPAEPARAPLPPTVPVALRIRAPRPPDMDVQTLAITVPDGDWQAAFYDRNGRRPNVSDYEMRHFTAEAIRRTGQLPTKAEWLFSRFRNFDREPGGVSEFS